MSGDQRGIDGIALDTSRIVMVYFLCMFSSLNQAKNGEKQ